MLHATACGHQHENGIWGEGREKFLGSPVTDYFKFATAKIIQCPHIDGGHNILCAHPRTVDTKQNYRTDMRQKIFAHPTLTASDKNTLLEKLENIFAIIDGLDQAVRFSYAGGPVLEPRYNIHLDLVDASLKEIYEQIWMILSQRGLNIFDFPEQDRGTLIESRKALDLETRKAFQSLVYSLQKMILEEYKRIFPQ